MDRKALIEALKAATQNDAGQFEISEEVICALVPLLTSDGHTIDSQKFEIATMARMQDQMDEHLKQQFDSMQISLIAFVMWKLNRQTLVIDSREINAGPFTHIVPSATMLDGYRTQYRLGRPGNY